MTYKLNLKNLAIYLSQINSYCFWVFFPCHSCIELYVNIYFPSDLYPLKSTILLQFHPPYNLYAVNPGQITFFFSIMLKVQLKSTKFHIYCSSYPICVITQLVHTLQVILSKINIFFNLVIYVPPIIPRRRKWTYQSIVILSKKYFHKKSKRLKLDNTIQLNWYICTA
jgi:hypothetical protein